MQMLRLAGRAFDFFLSNSLLHCHQVCFSFMAGTVYLRGLSVGASSFGKPAVPGTAGQLPRCASRDPTRVARCKSDVNECKAIFAIEVKRTPKPCDSGTADTVRQLLRRARGRLGVLPGGIDRSVSGNGLLLGAGETTYLPSPRGTC